MPIYEFYCPLCNMIFNFFSRTVNTEKQPTCPLCNKTRLRRHMSTFATPRNITEGGDSPLPDMDETRMEKVMALLAKEAENCDENNPRQAADLMRKLTDMTGMNLGPGMEEALKRMEAGEDPEKIESEAGDILENEDPFELKQISMKSKKYQPPGVDDKLYDL
ncbi:MAG TPA: zinc ribbon domain-containing protein [Desulfobacteraceae bacterium]|nr:zinc ribbon domain-containing protein [Desulfobacteraceae bacterium]